MESSADAFGQKNGDRYRVGGRLSRKRQDGCHMVSILKMMVRWWVECSQNKSSLTIDHSRWFIGADLDIRGSSGRVKFHIDLQVDILGAGFQ